MEGLGECKERKTPDYDVMQKELAINTEWQVKDMLQKLYSEKKMADLCKEIGRMKVRMTEIDKGQMDWSKAEETSNRLTQTETDLKGLKDHRTELEKTLIENRNAILIILIEVSIVID